ncbi:MAG: hypothetical protein WD403_15395 [Pirellulales bacterium]
MAVILRGIRDGPVKLAALSYRAAKHSQSLMRLEFWFWRILLVLLDLAMLGQVQLGSRHGAQKKGDKAQKKGDKSNYEQKKGDKSNYVPLIGLIPFFPRHRNAQATTRASTSAEPASIPNSQR